MIDMYYSAERRKKAVEKSPSTATYDSMTGLRDRMTFFQDVNRHQENQQQIHIIMIQLTRLMWVNRKYGIRAGDQLIRDAARWLENLDENYTVYRTANSRMTLVGPACSLPQAKSLMDRIHQRFQNNWHIPCGGQTLLVRAGAALVHLFLRPEDTENDLLDELNFGLSVIGPEGTEGMLFFDEDIRRDVERRKYVLDEIRYAVEHQTFQMYYQPIFSCRDKAFTSAESLVRLFDRAGKFISPGEFIPMAEDNGLIDQISWIVLEKVCRFLGERPNLPLGSASVNLTGQQLLDSTFIDRIETLLETYHLDGSRLRIEITERTITEDFKGVAQVMEYLGKRGVRFYLDDFGTGYSNLSSMLSLPFEVIKFDQSLVRVMNETDRGERTIRLLAEIMHENNYLVVAEGIETENQAATARAMGLDRIQGFFYAKPMPEDALMQFLAER